VLLPCICYNTLMIKEQQKQTPAEKALAAFITKTREAYQELAWRQPDFYTEARWPIYLSGALSMRAVIR